MLADAMLAVMWVGLTCYALLGGADFGAGLWDLLAGGTRAGMPRRQLVEHSIGPVWEANHVWLIFVLVVLWTAFPPVFAAVMSTLYVPLTLAALGVIARGASFAFRKASTGVGAQRAFGALFATSSVLTPAFLGTVAGAVASGRVPPGLARGDPLASWLNPTSWLAAVLAVLSCAYLAAAYLCADARRHGLDGLAEDFRRRGLVTAALTGAVALAGIAVLHADAPFLFHRLTHRALPLVALSAAAGLSSIGLLLGRRYLAVRLSAAVAVASVLWAWGWAQYPQMLVPDVTVAGSAARPSVLTATLVALGAGSVLLVPSLLWLFWTFQRTADTGR